MTEQDKDILINLLAELLETWKWIDQQLNNETKDSLLYGFLSRQLTAINILLEQIQYNFLILDTIGSKITWTVKAEEISQEQKEYVIDQILEKYNITKNENLIYSLTITTQWRSQSISAYLLYFVVIVRTNFEDFINTIFEKAYPEKETEKLSELEKNMQDIFWEEINIEEIWVQKFIKKRCKEYPFTNKLDLICKDLLNSNTIDWLKDLYNQRNSLHWLWIDRNNKIKHFKKWEENNFIAHLNDILNLTTTSGRKIYDKYKNDHHLHDITWIKQKEITWFEHKYEIIKSTI